MDSSFVRNVLTSPFFLSFFLCWGLLLAPGGELFQPMSTSSRAEQGDESDQP